MMTEQRLLVARWFGLLRGVLMVRPLTPVSLGAHNVTGIPWLSTQAERFFGFSRLLQLAVLACLFDR